MLEDSGHRHDGSPNPTSVNATPHNAMQRILGTEILNASDALDLLAAAAAKERPSLARSPVSYHPSRVMQSPIEVDPSIHPDWADFSLVNRGIVTAAEICEYLDFYFEQMWPLFLVVHPSYRHRSQYIRIFHEERVLLGALITVASRYTHLSGRHGVVRSERIHARAWKWTQMMLQSCIWGAASTGTLGTIAASMLFIEWHPRAINNPRDFIGDFNDCDDF